MVSKLPALRHSSTSSLGHCSAQKLLLWSQGAWLLGCCLFFSCSDDGGRLGHLTLRSLCNSHALHSTPELWIRTSRAQTASCGPRQARGPGDPLETPRLKRGRILYARRAQGRMGICKEQAVLKAAGSPSKIQCDLPALVICEEPGLLTEY